LIVLFFIPALWQRQSANPTLFFQNLWDGCEIVIMEMTRIESGYLLLPALF